MLNFSAASGWPDRSSGHLQRMHVANLKNLNLVVTVREDYLL